jgi:glycosyltransferase involved in cell wall biosynthesis
MSFCGTFLIGHHKRTLHEVIAGVARHCSIMNPRVSIGLLVYNGESFLAEALRSLLNQTYKDFALIISDNGSNDRTEDISREFARADDRVRYYRSNQNRGAAWNYRRVFELSNGEYFKWAAHDDLCAPEFIERCVDVLDRRPEVMLCYPRAILINEHGTRLRRCRDGVGVSSASSCERFRHLLANLGLSNPMFGVIRAKALALTHLMENYVATDIIMLAEIALRGEIYEIPEYLFFRRDHSQKSTRANTTLSEQAEWYDPGNKGRIVFLQWKLFSEHLASITRVPIGPHEKLRCYFYMAKWFRWHWNDLKSELVGLANERISNRKSKRISVRGEEQ